MMFKCLADTSECPQSLEVCCRSCELRKMCGSVCASVDEECKSREAEEPQELSNVLHSNAVMELTNICVKMKEFEEQKKKMVEDLRMQMERFGIKSLENDVIKVTYVEPTSRSSIDSAKLKKLYPMIAEECTKTSPVSASVRITVK